MCENKQFDFKPLKMSSKKGAYCEEIKAEDQLKTLFDFERKK